MENLIKALKALILYCKKEGVDYEEYEDLQEAVYLLDNMIEEEAIAAGMSQEEIEHIREHILLVEDAEEEKI